MKLVKYFIVANLSLYFTDVDAPSDDGIKNFANGDEPQLSPSNSNYHHRSPSLVHMLLHELQFPLKTKSQTLEFDSLINPSLETFNADVRSKFVSVHSVVSSVLY